MARNWIVVGDPTSSGGSVITGSPFTDVDGTPVARVNDQATCPRHKGAYPIVDGDSTLIVDGQPVALHGSSLACGCKVLSARQTRVFVDAGGGAIPAGSALKALGSPAGEINRSASMRQKFSGKEAKWSQREVLGYLCPQDKDVVDELAKTSVLVVDEVYFDDPFFDGKEWTTRRFQAGGFQDAENNRIVFLSGGTAHDAATTLYHEVVHEKQPGDMSWRDREIDAYTRTEAWTINRGLPGQGGLRKEGPGGKWVPDEEAIGQLVDRAYPITADSPGGPIVIGRDDVGNTLLSDGSSRAPRAGDTYPAVEETMIGVEELQAEMWRCPGEGGS